MKKKPPAKARSRSGVRARVKAPSRGARTLKRKSKLPQTARSKTEERMEELLGSLEPGTPRYRTLVSALEFKRSWVDLAQHLTDVMKVGAFKDWGYRTFDAYTQHELHIKKDTAQKLTRSFDFLSSHEGDVLKAAQRSGDSPPALPDFQALDVLAAARANPYLSEKDYREIRDQVFGEEISPGQVRKLVKERAPEPMKQVETDERGAKLRRCLQLAERLYGLLLEQEEIPERIQKAIEEAVGGLRRLIEE